MFMEHCNEQERFVAAYHCQSFTMNIIEYISHRLGKAMTSPHRQRPPSASQLESTARSISLLPACYRFSGQIALAE